MTAFYAIITNMTYNFKQLIISRLLAENVLLFLLQLMGVKFCLFSGAPLPVDFAAGTAAAFIFMRGYTILPGIWLGTFCAAYLSSSTLFDSSLLASAYTLQAALLFALCLRFISPGLVFIDRKLFLRFVMLCLAISLLFSPVTSWQANFSGLLIVTLAINYWDMYFPELANWRNIPNLCVLGTLFLVALLINLIGIICLPLFTPSILLNNIGIILSLLAVTLIWNNLKITSEVKHVVSATK